LLALLGNMLPLLLPSTQIIDGVEQIDNQTARICLARTSSVNPLPESHNLGL
jgi:hypothetical protein